MDIFARVEMLIGKDKLNILKRSKVLLFGVGGVGGFVAEGLVRSGIGEITLVDNDSVAESNCNRQIVATTLNINKDKVSEAEKRLISINPELKVKTVKAFFLPENSDLIDFSGYDYVIDAVDTVSAKIEIIKKAKEKNVPVISCMGTCGKLNISDLKVSDISQTKYCPLARVMRRELAKRGIEKVKVVYSEEKTATATNTQNAEKKGSCGRVAPPSMIFVPAAAGLIIAESVIKDLIKDS